jgi:hypothetical protein
VVTRTDVPKTAAQFRHEERLRQERERFAETASKFMASVILLPIHAWVLMLVLGAAHSVAAPVAAVGYGTAFLFVMGFDLAAATAKKFRRR